jgi:DNA-binding transcriptional MerR regulator
MSTLIIIWDGEFMDEKIIDVDFSEVDNRDYFTIEEASEKLDIEIGQLIYWCNKFDYLLKINSIGQFKIFSKEDIRNLVTIKELNIDKQMSIREIKEYLNQNTSAIAIRKDKELDLSIFNFFQNIINTQNDKLDAQNQKIEQLIEFQTKQLKLFSQIYNEIAIGDNEKNRTANKILENQKEQSEHVKNLENQIIDLKNTIENNSKERDIEISNNLKKILESHQLQQEQKENKKGILDILGIFFGSKK